MASPLINLFIRWLQLFEQTKDVVIEQLRRQLQTAQDEIDSLTTRMSQSIQTDHYSSLGSTGFESNTCTNTNAASLVDASPTSAQEVKKSLASDSL